MGKKILLIEDDPFLLEIYSKKLEEAGYVVEVATDGENGLNRIVELHPNLVLLDIILPKLAGLDVLARIKQDKSLEKIPVVILSNLGMDEEIKRAMALGADAYLIKSHYTPSEVVVKVGEVINNTK